LHDNETGTPMSELGQSRPFGTPPVNVWVTLDRGHWADTPALLGSAKPGHCGTAADGRNRRSSV
jgi:hypothetical protein